MPFPINTRRLLRQLPALFTACAIFVTGYALGHQQGITFAQNDTSLFQTLSQTDETQEKFTSFWQTYDLINALYVDPEGDPLNEDALINGAINGMVGALDDTFSYYIREEDLPTRDPRQTSQYVGIGVVINTIEDTGEIQVNTVLDSSPAEVAGVEVGDIFIEVDGQDVTGMNQEQLVDLARGPEGSVAEITFKRDDDPVDFSITRARLTAPTVRANTVEDHDNIGYIRISRFVNETRREIESHLDEINYTELDGLVIDLRGNPGGSLNGLIGASSVFLNDEVVLIEEFADGREEIITTRGDTLAPDIPIVVLVNGSTQSAAEAFTGALRDHDRAIALGTQTFGKGTVQRLNDLENGGTLRLTIARYMTPDRFGIHEVGITPDIVMELPDDTEEDVQLQAAVNHLLELD